MDCATARETISALLDDELAGIGRPLLDEHLARCAACRDWQDDAHELTRRTRLTAALDVPSPGPELLVAAVDAWGGRRRRTSAAVVRAGLVAVAAAQAGLALPALVFGSDRGAPVHVARELGSFDAALALGFLVAAWRPSRAQGMRALVGCAALLLAGTAALDLANGRTSLAEEAPHLLALAGWLLLRRLAALAPSSGDDRPALLPRLAGAGPALARRRPAGRRPARDEMLVDPDAAQDAAARDRGREPLRSRAEAG